jgi:hypothetical protein
MRSVPLIVAIVFFSAAAFAGEIREFDLPTLEQLGNELSRRNEIAARGTDLVEEQYPKSKPNWRGWITELGKSEDRVYVILDSVSGVSQGYTVLFPQSGQVKVEDHHGEPLPPNIAVRFKARLTALAAAKDKLYDVAYNCEVLDDPDGSGFLVYALAASKKRGEQILGGHFRVTVSADGLNAERVDALSRGIIKQMPKIPAGAKQAAIVVSQLVSDIPVETFLYSSYLYHLPVYVGTMDKAVWRVVNGKIEKVDPKLVKEVESKTEKKKKKK